MVGFITEAVPLSVRATAQYGIAKKEYGIDTPDLIETQIEWLTKIKQSLFRIMFLVGLILRRQLI